MIKDTYNAYHNTLDTMRVCIYKYSNFTFRHFQLPISFMIEMPEEL